MIMTNGRRSKLALPRSNGYLIGTIIPELRPAAATVWQGITLFAAISVSASP